MDRTIRPIRFRLVEKGKKGWSISFRDRSVEKVGRRKQGHWHWPQPARERVSLLPSFFFPPGGYLPPLPFPFPPPLFLLHHRHPLLYLLYVCSLRCDRDSKRRIGLVIFAPAAEKGRGGGDGPVRALIRDERVMSLTNKPSRYERFFWIAWRSMSWFLLSPRFDAAPSFPRVLLSLSLSPVVRLDFYDRSIFCNFAMFILFVIYLCVIQVFMRGVFASSLI